MPANGGDSDGAALDHLETELRQHREVFGVAAALRREVVAQDQAARAAAHPDGLQTSQRDLAAAGEPDERTR